MPKISELASMTAPASGDLIPIVDTAGVITKKVTRANLLAGSALPNNTVTTVAIADGAVTFAKTSGIWWEELGRTTLGTAGSTITVSSLPARKYLQVIIFVQATGGTLSCGVRFNGDTAGNYPTAFMDNGAASTSSNAATSISLSQSLGAQENAIINIQNLTGTEKLADGYSTVSVSTGTNVTMGRRDFFAKWANTSAQISSVTVANLFGGTGNYAIGSEVIVLGHN